MDTTNALSKSAIRKAGSILRAYQRGEATREQCNDAISTIQNYRAAFVLPLTKVSGNLRDFAQALNIDVEVSQRLKRLGTIYDKLTVRETGLDLSRMRDIGGCRVVTDNNDVSGVYELLEYAKKQWQSDVKRVIDYVATPRESGYRAIHIEVNQDGYIIEVQLRTRVMHAWAETAESFSYVFQKNYKQDGQSKVHDYMRLYSKLIQSVDSGLEWTQCDQQAYDVAVEDIRTLLKYISRG